MLLLLRRIARAGLRSLMVDEDRMCHYHDCPACPPASKCAILSYDVGHIQRGTTRVDAHTCACMHTRTYTCIDIDAHDLQVNAVHMFRNSMRQLCGTRGISVDTTFVQDAWSCSAALPLGQETPFVVSDC